MLMTSSGQSVSFGLQNAIVQMLGSINAPASRRRSKAPTAMGPLYTVTVPGTKAIIPHILSYGRLDGIVFRGDTWHVSKVTALPDGLKVDWLSRPTFDSPHMTASFTVPYVDARIQSVARGEWTDCGNGVQVQFDPQSLLPSISQVGDGVHVSWQVPPLVRWNNWFLRRIQVRVDRVVLHATGGSVSVSPRLAGFVAPDFEWE